MRIDVYLPLALSLLLAAVSPAVGRRLAPAPAARALAVSAALTAAASVWGLILLAATLLGDSPPVVAEAREHRFHIPEPVPFAIAIAALPALTAVVVRLWRTLRAVRVTGRALRRLSASHPGGTELIVAASAQPQAFAVPLRGPDAPGRILVSTGMLAVLDAPERQVLLAHERAHLVHGHSRLALLAEVAAAVNPLLIPVRDTIGFLLERWADERAAEAAGDRRVAARALARAALASHGSQAPLCAALGFSEHGITRRVSALQRAPLPTVRAAVLAVLLLGLVPAVGAADATHDFLRMMGRYLALWL
ncbi:M48 family metalloprotease [Actinacidiphila soli]|uniref:M48 family metalloprotease n=1 Tax=Actinacidiphila soli TaxID=2487275 RepID=UPI000FCA5A10|nr:M48 family metalloprotease [Actinacidiphila soli]